MSDNSDDGNTPTPTNLRLPIIQSPAVLLPGDLARLKIDAGDDLTKALFNSGNKVFITDPVSNKDGEMGVMGTVQLGAVPVGDDGKVLKAMVAVQSRVRLLDIDTKGAVPFATVERLEAQTGVDDEFAALARTTFTEFSKCFGRDFDRQTLELAKEIAEDQPAVLATFLARTMGLVPEKRKELQQTPDPRAQLKLISDVIAGINIQQSMDRDANKDMERKRDIYMLEERLQATQKKLKELRGGDDGEEEDEFDVLAKKITEADMPEAVQKKCEKDLKKLRDMNQQSSNYDNLMTWLEDMVTIPWNKTSEIEKNLKKVRSELDAGIFGLEEVKEFVIDEVAVQLHTGKPSGAVINLNGPPGVGKTAVGEVIAKATGRKFVRVALGGLHDEADIRGHRITYVGAIKGRIMKAFQEAGTKNPVLQLDELDKMGENGPNGDPSAALLEVLDPAQNHSFVDHYLGVEYDVSDALILCSTNDRSKIAGPLYDRVENFDVDGYTDDEKMVIAKDHLIKKQMEKYQLTDAQFSITDQALAKLIDGYTYEAGVRSLERLIRKLGRKATRKIEEDGVKSVEITPENLEQYLGPPKIERELVDPTPRVGHVNGLAVSGGSGLVLEIEGTTWADPRGGTEATGNLMQTIEESVRYSDAWVKGNAAKLGIPKEEYLDNTLHIKVDKGGGPVDGPSAGLALATLETSVRTDTPIRGDVAMTGEISVLGESGPIGGLRQKLDGAFRRGITTVLIPVANLKDFNDPRFPKKLKANLEIMPDANAENLAPVPEGKMRVIPVKNEMEVLQHALVRMPVPLAAESPVPKDVAGPFNDAAISDATVNRIAEAMLRKLFNNAGTIPANDDGGPQVYTGRHAMAGKAARTSP